MPELDYRTQGQCRAQQLQGQSMTWKSKQAVHQMTCTDRNVPENIFAFDCSCIQRFRGTQNTINSRRAPRSTMKKYYKAVYKVVRVLCQHVYVLGKFSAGIGQVWSRNTLMLVLGKENIILHPFFSALCCLVFLFDSLVLLSSSLRSQMEFVKGDVFSYICLLICVLWIMYFK